MYMYTCMYIWKVSQSFPFLYYLLLRQSHDAVQASLCLGLLCAGMTEVHHHTQPSEAGLSPHPCACP